MSIDECPLCTPKADIPDLSLLAPASLMLPGGVALVVGPSLALRHKSGSRRIIRDRGRLQFRIGGNQCIQLLPKLRHFVRDDGTGIQICHASYGPAV